LFVKLLIGVLNGYSHIKENGSFSNAFFLFHTVVNEHTIYFFIFAANVLCTGKTTLFWGTGRRVLASSISSTAN